MSIKSSEFLLLIQYILTEQQIILLGESQSKNLQYILFILALIKPLNWSYNVIPMLSYEMIDVLHASDPYIIGITPENFKKIKKIDLTKKIIIDMNSFKIQAK